MRVLLLLSQGMVTAVLATPLGFLKANGTAPHVHDDLFYSPTRVRSSSTTNTNRARRHGGIATTSHHTLCAPTPSSERISDGITTTTSAAATHRSAPAGPSSVCSTPNTAFLLPYPTTTHLPRRQLRSSNQYVARAHLLQGQARDAGAIQHLDRGGLCARPGRLLYPRRRRADQSWSRCRAPTQRTRTAELVVARNGHAGNARAREQSPSACRTPQAVFGTTRGVRVPQPSSVSPRSTRGARHAPFGFHQGVALSRDDSRKARTRCTADYHDQLGDPSVDRDRESSCVNDVISLQRRRNKQSF